MIGRRKRHARALLRWVLPISVTFALVLSLWAATSPHVLAAAHAHPMAGTHDHHASADGPFDHHCADALSAAEEDGSAPALGHASTAPCHTIPLQIGHLAAGSTLLVLTQVIDVLRPGAFPRLRGTDPEPPFTPPRSLA